MVALESLKFDNLALRALPVDEEKGSRIRQVAKANYSRVSPTPVKNPRLVAVSQPALQLLDLDPREVQNCLQTLKCFYSAALHGFPRAWSRLLD